MRGHDHLSPYLKFDFRFWTHARCLLPPRSCKITSLRLRSSDDFCWSSENLWLCVLLCYTNIESTLDREPKKHPVDGSNGSVDLDSTWSDIWHLTVWSIKIKTDFTTIPKRQVPSPRDSYKRVRSNSSTNSSSGEGICRAFSSSSIFNQASLSLSHRVSIGPSREGILKQHRASTIQGCY